MQGWGTMETFVVNVGNILQRTKQSGNTVMMSCTYTCKHKFKFLKLLTGVSIQNVNFNFVSLNILIKK